MRQSEEIEIQQEQQVIKDRKKCLELKNQGGLQFAQQNFEEAIDLYKEAIQYCPIEDNKMLCILNSNIGICLSQITDYVTAIEHFSIALEFDPSFVKALINRAECYEKNQQYKKAAQDYKQLEQLQPHNGNFRIKLEGLEEKVQEIEGKLEHQGDIESSEFLNRLFNIFGQAVTLKDDEIKKQF